MSTEPVEPVEPSSLPPADIPSGADTATFIAALKAKFVDLRELSKKSWLVRRRVGIELFEWLKHHLPWTEAERRLYFPEHFTPPPQPPTREQKKKLSRLWRLGRKKKT